MKKAIWIWIGMILLVLDTRITGILFFPKYIPFETPAPETVDMIIVHLIGDSAHIDLFSDLIAYLLIIGIACKIVNENKKAFAAFGFSILSLILYIANWGMPFVLNGEARYTAGFFLYIAYNLLKCVTTIQAGFMCCEMAECLENHAWNNVVAIFVMLASFAGFIRAMSHFYDLPKLTYVYFGIQLFFTLIYTVMFWKRRHFIKEAET